MDLRTVLLELLTGDCWNIDESIMRLTRVVVCSQIGEDKSNHTQLQSSIFCYQKTFLKFLRYSSSIKKKTLKFSGT